MSTDPNTAKTSAHYDPMCQSAATPPLYALVAPPDIRQYNHQNQHSSPANNNNETTSNDTSTTSSAQHSPTSPKSPKSGPQPSLHHQNVSSSDNNETNNNHNNHSNHNSSHLHQSHHLRKQQVVVDLEARLHELEDILKNVNEELQTRMNKFNTASGHHHPHQNFAASSSTNTTAAASHHSTASTTPVHHSNANNIINSTSPPNTAEPQQHHSHHLTSPQQQLIYSLSFKLLERTAALDAKGVKEVLANATREKIDLVEAFTNQQHHHHYGHHHHLNHSQNNNNNNAAPSFQKALQDEIDKKQNNSATSTPCTTATTSPSSNLSKQVSPEVIAAVAAAASDNQNDKNNTNQKQSFPSAPNANGLYRKSQYSLSANSFNLTNSASSVVSVGLHHHQHQPTAVLVDMEGQTPLHLIASRKMKAPANSSNNNIKDTTSTHHHTSNSSATCSTATTNTHLTITTTATNEKRDLHHHHNLPVTTSTSNQQNNNNSANNSTVKTTILEILKVLLKYGFSVDSLDDHGLTPIDAAREAGNKELVEFMLNHRPNDMNDENDEDEEEEEESSAKDDTTASFNDDDDEEEEDSGSVGGDLDSEIVQNEGGDAQRENKHHSKKTKKNHKSKKEKGNKTESNPASLISEDFSATLTYGSPILPIVPTKSVNTENDTSNTSEAKILTKIPPISSKIGEQNDNNNTTTTTKATITTSIPASPSREEMTQPIHSTISYHSSNSATMFVAATNEKQTPSRLVINDSFDRRHSQREHEIENDIFSNSRNNNNNNSNNNGKGGMKSSGEANSKELEHHHRSKHHQNNKNHHHEHNHEEHIRLSPTNTPTTTLTQHGNNNLATRNNNNNSNITKSSSAKKKLRLGAGGSATSNDHNTSFSTSWMVNTHHNKPGSSPSNSSRLLIPRSQTLESFAEERLYGVIILVGLPARGKTYFAHRVQRFFMFKAAEVGCFSAGEVRRQMFPGVGRAEVTEEQLEKISDEVALQAADFIADHTPEQCTAIIDGLNHSRALRSRLFGTLCAHGVPPTSIIFLEIVVTEEDVVERHIKTAVEDYMLGGHGLVGESQTNPGHFGVVNFHGNNNDNNNAASSNKSSPQKESSSAGDNITNSNNNTMENKEQSNSTEGVVSPPFSPSLDLGVQRRKSSATSWAAHQPPNDGEHEQQQQKHLISPVLSARRGMMTALENQQQTESFEINENDNNATTTTATASGMGHQKSSSSTSVTPRAGAANAPNSSSSSKLVPSVHQSESVVENIAKLKLLTSQIPGIDMMMMNNNNNNNNSNSANNEKREGSMEAGDSEGKSNTTPSPDSLSVNNSRQTSDANNSAGTSKTTSPPSIVTVIKNSENNNNNKINNADDDDDDNEKRKTAGAVGIPNSAASLLILQQHLTQDEEEEFREKYRMLIAQMEAKYETMDHYKEGALCFARSVNRTQLLCHNLAYTPIGRTLSRLLMDIHESDRKYIFAPIGETAAAKQGRYGVFDSALTEEGEAYAERLAAHLLRYHIPEEDLIDNTTILTCSAPAGRRTVAPLVAKLKNQEAKNRQVRYLHTLDDLNYGDCDGMTQEEIRKQFPRHSSLLIGSGGKRQKQQHDDDDDDDQKNDKKENDNNNHCGDDDDDDDDASFDPSASYYMNWPRGESFEMMMQVRIEQHISELEAQTQKNIVVVVPTVVLQALLLYFDQARYPVIRPEEAVSRVVIPKGSIVCLTGSGGAYEEPWEKI